MTNFFTRRQMLQRAGAGFGSLALADLLARQSVCSAAALSDTSSIVGAGHFPARAKRVIFLFMHGGPSQVDTFDYKPQLAARNGEPLPFAKPRIQFAQTGNLLSSPWKFRQSSGHTHWFVKTQHENIRGGDHKHDERKCAEVNAIDAVGPPKRPRSTQTSWHSHVR